MSPDGVYRQRVGQDSGVCEDVKREGERVFMRHAFAISSRGACPARPAPKSDAWGRPRGYRFHLAK